MPDDRPVPVTAESLLTDQDPLPFFVQNPDSDIPILLVCDHASARFPVSLGDMGLDAFARRCHLAVDIGAGPLTEYLADSLGVTAVLAQYSRLVVDCNRHLMDASAFLQFGDGIRVPANCQLRREEKAARSEAIYEPYHAAIDAELDRLIEAGSAPAFIALHSFTPVLNGESRKWEFGILWDNDQSLHELFVEDLRKEGFEVGDNEPYSGKAPADYTVDNHGEARSLPSVGIEVRQDLLSDPSGIARIGNVLHRVIESIPGRLPAYQKAGSRVNNA